MEAATAEGTYCLRRICVATLGRWVDLLGIGPERGAQDIERLLVYYCLRIGNGELQEPA